MNNRKISTNPENGNEYLLPTHLDDKKNIDDFLSKNENKKVIVVQGLGFVGSVMSLVCANRAQDYVVIGVDIADEKNYWKIATLNEGNFPLKAEDENIYDIFEEVSQNQSFYATYDSYAFNFADVILVDINLDVKKNYSNTNLLDDFSVSLSGFEDAIKSIGANCKEDALIIVETTVPPGTTNNLVYPLLKKSLEKRGLNSDSIKVGHSYERVMPGPDYVDSIINFFRVYSGVNEESELATASFLETIINTKEFPLTKLENTASTEIAKVLENSYRAMNIAFMVEWSRFAEESGVNLYKVVEAIRKRPTHSNIMLPGLGVGGYCLTKDPLLASWAKQNFFKSSDGLVFSEDSVRINDQMPKFAFDFFRNSYKESLDKKEVLFLGVSYRGDVGDTRSTPVSPLYDLFYESGAKISLHDPFVSFWEEKNLKVKANLEDFKNRELDIVLISSGHSFYQSEKFNDFLFEREGLFIFDTIGCLDQDIINTLSQKHSIKVLGRGDL